MANKNPKIILVDLEETVFPEAYSYNEWLWKNHGLLLDPLQLEKHKVGRILGKNHKKFYTEFINNPLTIYKQKPRLDALASLSLLQETHTIVLCSDRMEEKHGDGTRSWVEQHLPFIQDIIYTKNKNHTQRKQDIVKKVKPVAFIDDESRNFKKINSHCAAILIQKNYPRVSEPNAVTWRVAVKKLQKLIH